LFQKEVGGMASRHDWYENKNKRHFFHCFFQLEKLYEGYKRTERKAVPKAHQLMEWLKNNLPRENRKPGT